MVGPQRQILAIACLQSSSVEIHPGICSRVFRTRPRGTKAVRRAEPARHWLRRGSAVRTYGANGFYGPGRRSFGKERENGFCSFGRLGASAELSRRNRRSAGRRGG